MFANANRARQNTKKRFWMSVAQTSEPKTVKVLTSPIAKPMASHKLKKKLLELTTKASTDKLTRRGVKEVVKAIRKGEKGFVFCTKRERLRHLHAARLCIIAGDISPIDVITHVPLLCEDQDVPYIYVSSRAELGAASSTKRPTSVVLVKAHADGDELFDECRKKISDAAPVL